MKRITAVLAISALLTPATSAQSQGTRHSFTFHAATVGEAVLLNGGGSYDTQSGLVQGGGVFRATKDILTGPLAGLRAGDGARWEAAELLPSSGFKCSGAPEEPLKTAVTDDDTIVMQARFYREGDGASASFTAKVFVSTADEDPGQPGVQNVWIQGVGCADAAVNVH